MARAEARMQEVCGDLGSCPNFAETVDANFGTDSLFSVKLPDGDFQISGLMSFQRVALDTTGDTFALNSNAYIDRLLTDGLAENSPILTRIEQSLISVNSRIEQRIALLVNDPQLDICVNGRDMRNVRTGANRTVERFPRLLDSFKLNIINSGLEIANRNYNSRFNKLLATANKDATSEIKSQQCYMMASSAQSPACEEWGMTSDGEPRCEKFSTGLLSFGDTAAGFTQGGTMFTLPGAKLEDLARIASTGKGEFVVTDGDGNMTASVSITASFSPEEDICTLATTTMGCKGMEAVITTSTSKSCGNGGVLHIGNCGGGGFNLFGGGSKKTSTTQSFHGTVCTAFHEPRVTTERLAM